MLRILQTSLRARIFSLIAPALMLLAGMIALTYSSTRQSAEEDKGGIVELAAQSGAVATRSVAEGYGSLFQGWLATDGETLGISIEFDLLDEVRGVFEDMQTKAPEFASWSLVGLDGTMLQSLGDLELDDTSIAYLGQRRDELLAGAGMAGLTPDASAFPAAASSLLFVAPVQDSSAEPIGLFLATIDLASLAGPLGSTQELLRSKGLAQANVALVDLSAGQVLATASPLASTDLDKQLVTAIADTERGRSVPVELGGTTWFAAASSPDGLDSIALVAIEPQDELLASAHALLIKNLATGAAGGLVLVALYWLLSGRISRPVSVAADALAEIAGAEIDATKRLEVTGRDELARLGESFNTMMVKLQAMIQEIDAGARAVQRYRPMVVNSPDALVFADPDLRVQYLNPAAEAFLATHETRLGVPSDEVLDSSLEVFFEDFAGLRDAIRDEPAQTHSFQGRFGDRVFDTMTSALHATEGEHLGWMTVVRDVTDQLEAERTIRDQAEDSARDARELADKVNAILKVVTAASEGDLTGHVEVEGEDDIAKLASELDSFFDSLRADLGVILGTSHELVQEASDLERANEGISSAAKQASIAAAEALERASSTQENSNSVSQGTGQLGQSIEEIASSSGRAAQVARQGVELARKTVADFKTLEDDSVKIGDVLTSINTIAEQTNLLALNATIEAARAGESGKGFAVVANEVKALAQETTDLTSEVAERVGAIRSSTTRGATSVGEIFTLIEQIDEVQTGIAGAVEEQSAVTAEIGSEVSQIAGAGEEIVERLDGVSREAKVTAQGVSQTARTAENLSSIATKLQGMVGRFTID